MSLTYVGSLRLDALIPASFALFATLQTDIQAQLTASLNMQANISIMPPSLAATITVAESIVANLQAAVALSPPSVSIGASLSAQIGILQGLIANLAAIIALGATAADVWSWAGAVNAFGPALTAALAGGAPSGGLPTDSSHAIVLLTRSPADWAAMTSFFGGI